MHAIRQEACKRCKQNSEKRQRRLMSAVFVLAGRTNILTALVRRPTASTRVFTPMRRSMRCSGVTGTLGVDRDR